MPDRLFDLDDPGRRGLHPDYAPWPVSVTETIEHNRGPLGSADRLIACVLICLREWGVGAPAGEDRPIWLDADETKVAGHAFDYTFRGHVVARTAAEANEELRRLVWRAIDATEVDWQRLEQTRDADLPSWRPPVLPSP